MLKHAARLKPTSLPFLAKAYQHLWLLVVDDASPKSSLTLTIPVMIAPTPPDAGRDTFPSRLRCSFLRRMVPLSEGFRRFVASSPYLVAYCRWDDRSGHPCGKPDNHNCDFVSHTSSTTNRCTPTPCAPFVPHSATGAGELGRSIAARGLDINFYK